MVPILILLKCIITFLLVCWGPIYFFYFFRQPYSASNTNELPSSTVEQPQEFNAPQDFWDQKFNIFLYQPVRTCVPASSSCQTHTSNASTYRQKRGVSTHFRSHKLSSLWPLVIPEAVSFFSCILGNMFWCGMSRIFVWASQPSGWLRIRAFNCCHQRGTRSTGLSDLLQGTIRPE